MKKLTTLKTCLVLIPAAIFATACGRNSGANDALKNDLALAAQAQPYMGQFNPAEQSPYNPYGYNPYVAQQYQAAQRAPVQSAPRTVSRPAATRTSSSSGSGTIYRAPAPAPQAIKHTKRDAAIGPAAGAVIGAATSRDKVKGGLIGAAAGAILGGVIGNNVDITRKY